jgi:hypothetical protein
MRHLNIKLISILLLGFLGASSASAGVYSYIIGQSTGESNAHYEEQQKARAEGRISCVPQPPQDPQYNLWTCSDAYGNQYENMVITLKSEIENLKGKKLAAGLGWPKPDPKPTPTPPKKP